MEINEFWKGVPEDIRKELSMFAINSLGISKEDKEEIGKFKKSYYDVYEQCKHIEDEQTRYQLAYGLLMKKYRLTGGGGDVETRIKPFFVSNMRKVTFKSDGTEHVVTDMRGLARREDGDGENKITYVTATFWDEHAVTASEELKPNTEYKTKLIWKVDKNTGSKSLTVARNSQLILEPQNDNQLPSFEEFSNVILQDTTKVISGLDDLLNYEKMMQLGLYSKHPTDIKVIPYATVIDSRLIEKGDRKIGLMEIIDKSILTDREKSLIFWTDENQLVGRGSIIHAIGEIRPNTETKTITFNLHFIYPVKVIKFVDDFGAMAKPQPEVTTPPVVNTEELTKETSTEEKKEGVEVGETEFDDSEFSF